MQVCVLQSFVRGGSGRVERTDRRGDAFMETRLLAFIQNIGPFELVIILGVALLIFGRRLPEVGRSLGKGIVEFKRGIKGIDDELENETTRARSGQFERGNRSSLPEADERRDDRRDDRRDERSDDRRDDRRVSRDDRGEPVVETVGEKVAEKVERRDRAE